MVEKKYRIASYADSTRRLTVVRSCVAIEVDDLFIYCYDLVEGELELETVFPIGRLKMIENLEIVPVKRDSQAGLRVVV